MGHSFHQKQNGDILCDECNTWEDEVMGDFYDSDLANEEEDGAFEDVE
jgi:hypothetical protein